MQRVLLTCNRCKLDVVLSPGDRSEFVTLHVGALRVNSAGDTSRGIDLCQSCVRHVAEAIGDAGRDAFAPHVYHDCAIPIFASSVVKSGETLQLAYRFTSKTLIESIVIEDRDDWTIEEITIGHRSQRSYDPVNRQHSPPNFPLEIADAGMDFILTATYKGKNPNGGIFSAVTYGRAVGWKA